MDVPQPTAALQPIRLGRYRITSQIGNGVSGTVYRAWDDELRRDVAIRVPHRDRLISPSQVDEYVASARQLSRLDHPRIVPLYDVGRTDDGQCYLVTKFISGGNLAGRVLRHPPFAAW
ncbi:MAG TPA: protein kinase, partial [Planctomycetaceae bacterium]